MAYPIELLKENYNPVVFFCNPNIYPEEEYLRRRDELIKYCEQEEYPYIIDDYIAFSNTPIYESRAYDGVIREGIGIDPDDSSIPFSITEFESGTDSRLTRAFDRIRTGI